MTIMMFPDTGSNQFSPGWTSVLASSFGCQAPGFGAMLRGRGLWKSRFVCLFLFVSFFVFFCLFFCSFVCLFVCLFVRLFVCSFVFCLFSFQYFKDHMITMMISNWIKIVSLWCKDVNDTDYVWDKGLCTYYVITDRGGVLSKWLHRGVSQMITVLHRGGLEYDYGITGGGPTNDYGIPWTLGYYMRNIISIDLTKKSDFFQLVKNHFCRVCQND